MATAATMVAFELASGLAVPRPPSFHDRLPDVGVPTGELFAGPFVSSTGTGTAGETGARRAQAPVTRAAKPTAREPFVNWSSSSLWSPRGDSLRSENGGYLSAFAGRLREPLLGLFDRYVENGGNHLPRYVGAYGVLDCVVERLVGVADGVGNRLLLRCEVGR